MPVLPALLSQHSDHAMLGWVAARTAPLRWLTKQALAASWLSWGLKIDTWCAGGWWIDVSERVAPTLLHLQVVEIIPPAVNTDLGGVGKHTFGVPLNDFADSVSDTLTACGCG